MDVGESWAHIPRSQDLLVEKELLRSGTNRAARTLVRFVDVSFDGKQEWVSPTRLKAPWVPLHTHSC